MHTKDQEKNVAIKTLAIYQHFKLSLWHFQGIKTVLATRHLNSTSSTQFHVHRLDLQDLCFAGSCSAEQKPRQEVITAEELMPIENV